MWLPLVLPFVVYFFHADFPVFLYFMWIFRVFLTMSASLIMGLENGFLMLSKLDVQIWKKKEGAGVSRTTTCVALVEVSVTGEWKKQNKGRRTEDDLQLSRGIFVLRFSFLWGWIEVKRVAVQNDPLHVLSVTPPL